MITDPTRLLQRLDQRGDLSVTMDMRAPVAREWTEGFVGHTEYRQTNRPWWHVSLTINDSRGWAWTLMLGHRVAEGWDLVEALIEVEAATKPRRQSLEDRVDDHRYFIEVCDAGIAL